MSDVKGSIDSVSLSEMGIYLKGQIYRVICNRRKRRMHNMNMKQIKKVAPLAVLSATVLLSPTHSFAEEKSIPHANVQNIAGQTSNR